MKKLALLAAAFCILLVQAKPASAYVVNLIEAFDTYDDNVIRFGDGFGSKPVNLDNDFDRYGSHDYRSVVVGTFSLPSLAVDNAFTITTVTDNVQLAHYFTVNDNPTPLYLNTNETGLAFNNFFKVGENKMTFHILSLSSTNMDDFSMSTFDLIYNPAPLPTNAVPEPATMLLFSVGMLGLAARRCKV